MDYGLSDKNMMAKDDIFIYKNDKQEFMAKKVGWEPKDGMMREVGSGVKGQRWLLGRSRALSMV